MRARTTTFSLIATLGIVASMAIAGAGADARSLNMEEVAFLPIDQSTHLEFWQREIGGDTHHFALLGSRSAAAETGGGLNVIDITDPEAPAVVVQIPCVNAGGAVDPKAVPVTHTIDGISYDTILAFSYNDSVACLWDDPETPEVETERVGAVAFAGVRATPEEGDLITVDFLGSPIVDVDGNEFRWTKGPAAHTIVNHPSEAVLYAGNQMIADRFPSIEIIDLRTWPPVGRSHQFLPSRATTGVGPHDITFNPEGTRAYAATISMTVVLDTTGEKVLAPGPIGLTKGARIDHEAVLHPDGRHLIVADEFVATSGENAGQCPGGGVHVFDLGPNSEFETSPVEVGAFFAQDLSTPGIEQTDEGPEAHLEISCTAHEFNYAPDGSFMPIGWYGAGVRVFDTSALAAVGDAPAPAPVTLNEIGYYVPAGIVEFWSAKVHPADPTYIVASDTPNGLRIFRYTGELP